MKQSMVPRLLERARAHLTNDEYSEAQKIYSDILFAKPHNTDALFGVGLVAQKLKRIDLALSFFSKVIAIDGQHEEALFQRGKTHIIAKNFEQAIADLTSTLKKNPTSIDALNSRGIANSQLSNFRCAVKDFDKAIQICPSNADLFYNRGLAHSNLKNYDAAVLDYTYAIKLRPDFYQAFNNRGSAYRELADFKMALKDFKTSTTLKSDFADGYWNQSLIYLMNGEYEKAWPLYEYRWKSKHFPSEKRNFSEPLWLGNQSIEGKTILIHSEQGLGDTIHFCRYIKLLQQKKCKILLEVEKPLINLMGCLLPKANIFQKGHMLPKFDFHCPLVSLPLVFETNVNSVPFPTPYLKADHSRVTWWRTHLGNSMKPRVGLCWRGNPQHPNDKRRSIALSDIIGTLGSEFDWLSLQYEIDDQESNVLKKSQKIRHFGSLIGDFAETAALCKALDAIICVDTSIAHLAGATGSDTYLLLAQVADSRWHASGNNTPWYENVTILRKTSHTGYPELLTRAQILIGQQKELKTT
ncbi:MAG: tetratricopeptide repeat protein [Paracoccaceae bacterium]